MNRVLEYIIRAKDATRGAISSAYDRVKQFTSKVSNLMPKFRKDLDPKEVEEKFVHTTAVLDRIGLALDRLGVSGQDFNDVYDTMKKRLDDFNRTGQGADELMQHFKLSMEDVGMSAKNVTNGLEFLKSQMVGMGKAGSEAGKVAGKGFNPLIAATAAASGNFGQFTYQVAHLIPGLEKMGLAGTAACGLIATAVMSVIKFVSALRELLITVFNTGAMPKSITSASNALLRMVSDSKRFYENMDEARKKSETLSNRFEEITKSINAATKAQNEFNRAQELAAAKSDEERESINAKYDTLNRKADEGMSAELLKRQRQDLQEERKRLNAELEQSQKDQDEYLRKSMYFNRRARIEMPSGVMSGLLSHIGTGFYGGKDSTERADAWNRATQTASDAYDEAVEKEAEIRKKLEEVEHKLQVVDMNQKTAKTLEKAGAKMDEARANEKAQEEEEKRLKQEQKDAEDALKEIERQEREYERMLKQQERERLEIEREVARERDRLQRQTIKEYEQQLRDAQSEQSVAERWLSEAQAKSREAWGWYRDKDSLQKQLDEEKANAEAEKQFEKDFAKLKRRGINWRTADNLSLEDEAVRRVGLAREEEKAAQQYAQQTAEATQAAAEALEEIKAAIVESAGGEE